MCERIRVRVQIKAGRTFSIVHRSYEWMLGLSSLRRTNFSRVSIQIKQQRSYSCQEIICFKKMRGRSYSYSPSPSPSRGYGRRRRSPSPRGKYSSGMPTSLLVRNLRHDCRSEDLRSLFGRFGPVKDVYLPRDYYSGEPRGFGFVQFVDPADAADAKYELDGYVLLGRELTVLFAEENRKKPSQMRQRERQRSRSYDGRRTRSPGYRRRSYSRSSDHHSERRRRYSRSRSPRDRSYDRRSHSRSPIRSRSRSRDSYDRRSHSRSSTPHSG